MDYEINELGEQTKKGCRGFAVSVPVEDLIICKETVKQVMMMMMMINQMDLTERLAICVIPS